MRISIAMAVYNGELFMSEQLDSFLRQTRLPDELVISDDCSTDGSVEIARTFAAKAPFPVQVRVNPRNLGANANFEQAINNCTGDIIFTSDFDDVWYPGKLATMEQAFTAWPKAGVAVCDADLVDEDLRPIGRRLWQSYHFAPGRRMRKRMAIGGAFRRSVPMHGMCMAFRSCLKRVILPLPTDNPRVVWWDSFIGWTIGYSGTAGVVVVPSALAAYRQHGNQAVGAPVHESILNFWARLFAERRHRAWSPLYAAVSTRLELLPTLENPINPTIRQTVLRHWYLRRDLPQSTIARVPIILRELIAGRYHRFSDGFGTALKDALFVE
jgi:glycosyltransferase involved in cell wall biosynthesis